MKIEGMKKIEDGVILVGLTRAHCEVIRCENGGYIGKVSRFITADYQQGGDYYHDREQEVSVYTSRNLSTADEAMAEAIKLAERPMRLEVRE